MIPKIIHQTWSSKEENHSIDKLRDTWIKKNPHFLYHYYDDNDIHAYIEEHFDEHTLHCYNRIVNGSLKADFFRYCVLYKEGGVYIDVDIACLVPLDDLFDLDNMDVITATDYCRIQRSDRIYQGFLGGSQHCPLFMNMIEQICNSMDKDLFKNDLFKLSGPIVFSRFLKMHMNISINEKNEKCSFLKELHFTNIRERKHYYIVTHEISKELLLKNGVKFATAQNRIDRVNNLHYFKHKSKFPEGFYI